MTVVHAAASFSDIRNGLESLDGAQANQVLLGFPACVRSMAFDSDDNPGLPSCAMLSKKSLRRRSGGAKRVLLITFFMSLVFVFSWSQASELQRLVRDHFDSFVRCADSIEKYASHINIELSKNKEQVRCCETRVVYC